MFPFKPAICYSGYRHGQNPRTETYPSDAEVLEDLLILIKHFSYIRMYDVSEHAKSVLRVITANKLPLKVLLGVEVKGEVSNPNCPWGGVYTDEELVEHKAFNIAQLDQVAQLGNQYQDIVLGISIGNENMAHWHPNKVTPESLVEHAKILKTKTSLPLTFCEGAYEWRNQGQELAKVVDFISIHVYPLWQRVPYHEAVKLTTDQYYETKAAFPDKPVIFTEFGWTTSATENMNLDEVNEELHKGYLNQMIEWSNEHQVTMFIFEAFDEPWKGGDNPLEAEKHWGIYNVDRTPKSWIAQF
ncbi:MAG: glycosyl hydrolase [Erysipelotrichia bacterium]|jgi:exo-beta-1,3-glucanase (GH17 family)|nr:glycosyl hydrolase [Erysipelotrichia bacterium]